MECKTFLDNVQKQVLSLGPNAKIAVKICTCKSHVHNLRYLYKNFANRGEQTKEVIKCVITKGEFEFSLAPDRTKIVFCVIYKENQKRRINNESTLLDIKSRAHLLLNSERQSSDSKINQEEFRRFIKAIDTGIEIRDIIYELHTSGHIQYRKIHEKIQSKGLEKERETLCKELKQWNKRLLAARNDSYLLNFVQGYQIHVLHQYLKDNEAEEQVEVLLKFIHPQLSANQIKEVYQCREQKTETMKDIGNAIHSVFRSKRLRLHYSELHLKGLVKRIDEVVHNGRILLANLDIESPLVIHTLLALYVNTTGHFPEPNQVLLCTIETSWNEIYLLLERSTRVFDFNNTLPLYCLANIEKLHSNMLLQLVDALLSLKDSTNFRLAIIYRGSENHFFIDQLHENVAIIQPVSDLAMENLFRGKCPNVITYTSEVAGLGKTTKISQYAHSLRCSSKSLQISGTISRHKLIERLSNLKLKSYHVLHLDIGAISNPAELDTFLFELIVLRFVSSEKQAFYVPTENVCIEIANTINNTLCDSLPMATAFSRCHLEWNEFEKFTVSKEVNSPTQVVCRYLDLLEEGKIDTIDAQLVDDATIVSENRCRYLLRAVFANSADISYSMVHVFLSFLADQLKRLSESPFLRVRHIPEMIDSKDPPSIRSTFVQSMTEVAIEFATRSVRSCRSAQIRTVGNDESSDSSDNILQLVNRVDGMIHWEDSNHIMFVFHNQDIHTLSLLYRDIKQVPAIIHNLFKTQMRRKLEDYNGLPQEQLQEILQRVARYKPGLLPSGRLISMSKDYALTPDNLLKMVLIMLRITSHIPVVIMGETGCGKTSLIRYLAEIAGVHLSIMNVHAGVDSLDVVTTVFKENDQCLKDCSSQRWIFFDEFNTSECIGTISDVLCHHLCDGKLLAPNFIPIGACNPYKLRSTQEILTEGLDHKASTDNLSKLVYRVLPLPESAIDFVWDFGSLTVEDEKKYIMRMVSGVLKDKSDDITFLFCDVLVESQLFVRRSQHNAYSVSLREVFRCKRLVIWFMDILKRKTTTVKRKKLMTVSSTAIIMSLAHVYHSRFEKKIRQEYRNMISTVFGRHGIICDESVIHSVIKSEQMDILNSMTLPRGTAKNTALRENIFVILVCILNKIPVFVVGKPGCSKSLAMQVIRSNLRGKDSENEFFKTLPQLFCVSFQGSESSTSEGIEKVFEKAEKYQKSNNIEDVLSVVILDEIGLAEISKFNPLKVLHSLLEPEPRSFPNIAVVGISNWALDASKMNRAIHLSRPDMDEEELFDTAVSISESFFEESVRKHGLQGDYKNTSHNVDIIKNGLKQVAKCYFRYTKEGQFVNFHGLRDFYALVKFIAKALTNISSDEDRYEPFKHAVMEGLQRNFGGICRQELDVFSYFRECFDGSLQQFKHVQSLIEANVEDQFARHLMIITRGDYALNIVEQTLKETNKCKKEVIFGSQFVEDLTDDYHYRILSRIILCMEQGYVLILKDLENIYGSLYDMLNQNYSRIGNRNICRIALGPYSNPFCHVAEDFRCIVLVNENRIDFKDPPFLNRFEKQFVSYSDILQTDEEVLVRDVNKWINNVSRIKDRHFGKGDVFPYFNHEMVVSLVIWSTRNIAASHKNAFELCKHVLVQIMKPEAVLRLQHAEDYEVRSAANILLQRYFELPLHHGLAHYIQHDVLSNSDENVCGNLTIVFTNSALHKNIGNDLKNCQSETIASFKSEKQLSLNLQRFWESNQTEVLLVTCNASEDEKHLMLTKSLIEKFKAEKYDHNEITKRVYLVIHMRGWNALYGSTIPQCSPVTQINFLSGWKLVLIDTLETPNISLPNLYLQSLSDVVESMTLTELLKRELFWAFTRIKYGSHGRDIKSITEMLSQLERSEEFLTAIGHRVLMYIKDNETEQDIDWCSYVANDVHLLHTSSFFVDALEKYIISVIKEPFAKIMFKLETYGALESFFVQDCFTSMRRSFWKRIFFDERIIDIASVKPESGPECYMCNTTDIFLKSPFSRIIFETAEATKDEFLDEVTKVKITCELESDLDLPDSVLNELLLQHEFSILSKLPDLSNYFISHEIYLLDYLTDYCSLTIDTIFFSEIHDQMSRSNRIECICWCLEQKIEIDMDDYISFFTRLHCAGWINFTLFRYLLQLLDICKFALNTEDALLNFQQDSKNKDKTENKPSPIDGFISFICSSLFPTEENIQRYSGIDKWLTVVSKVLTLASEISVEPESYHALRFSVDMVSDLIIDSEINANVLFRLGDQLEMFSIDSSEVYEAFHDMITKILAAPLTERVQEAIQRSMCQYLVSCLSTHPDTIAYENFFELLKCFPVLSKCVNFSKLPIKYLLGRATENILYQLIHNDTEEELTDAFLCCLNECLGDVLQEQTPHRELTLLVIDLMENLYKEGNLSLPDMLACGRIVQERQVSGIRMVAAIAYVRASLEDFSKIILAPRQSDCNEILDLLDALLHGWEGSSTQKGVMLFFLKHLAENRHFHDLSKICNQFTSRIQELKKIKWTDKYISCGFEQNPLVDFFSKDVLQKCEAANDVFNRKQQEYSSTLKIVQGTSRSCLLPFHISLKEFYFPRTYRQLTETEKRKADKLGDIFSTCLDPIQRKTLQYIVGKNDFITSIFTPHTELSFEEYMINYVLVSSFSLSISTCSNIECEKLPFLPLCLLKPSLLKERYIPGVLDPIKTISSFRSGILPCNELYMCKCGKTLMCRKSGDIVCIACKRPCLDPPVTRYERSDANQQSHSQKGLKLIQSPDSLTSVRGLSPVSTAILQFLVTGNLLGSVAFEYSEWSALEDVVTEVSAIDMKRFLEKHVFDSWRFLKSVLNLNDNLLGIFISSVLYECNVYAYQQQNVFSTPGSRTVWENKFNEVVIQMLPRKLRICSARVWKCDNIYEFPTGCIEQMIREVSDPLGDTCKPSELYFRMSSYPSKDNFCYQLWEHRDEHPLLAIVVGNEKTLRAIQHIYTIIQWHMTTVYNASYIITRNECETCTVAGYHSKQTNPSQRAKSQQKFSLFKECMNELIDIFGEKFSNTDKVTSNSKLSQCLLLETGNGIYEMLMTLINLQNSFLEKALALSETCPQLQFLQGNKNVSYVDSVPIAEVKRMHLIEIKTEIDEYFQDESHCWLQYGEGREIKYDFYSIEKTIAKDLLVGKAYINLSELPSILFIDDLYENFVSLVNEIRRNIPQSIVPDDLAKSLREKSLGNPSLASELIHFIDMVFTLLKKTQCDPKKSLSEFAEERKNIIGQPFPVQLLPHPENRIKVSHVVSLHETLEEICYESIRDSLSDIYIIDLGPRIRDHLKSVLTMKKADVILKALKIFVYRCLFMMGVSSDQELCYYLCKESFWPKDTVQNGFLCVDAKKEPVKDIFISDMQVCHAVKVIEEISSFVEKQKRVDVRLDKLITDWKSSSGRQTQQKMALTKIKRR